VLADRSQFFMDLTMPFYGFNRPGAKVSQEVREIVPIGASAMLSAKLIKGSTLKVYPGLSHGLCTLNKDQINADLLAFIKG
jgi:non-heme chloroperoxidase